jgi:hypothetical protein
VLLGLAVPRFCELVGCEAGFVGHMLFWEDTTFVKWEGSVESSLLAE